MIPDYQNMDTPVEEESPPEEQSSEYWTKERMQEAEPQEMSAVHLKDIVRDALPVLIIVFVILTIAFILRNRRKIYF